METRCVSYYAFCISIPLVLFLPLFVCSSTKVNRQNGGAGKSLSIFPVKTSSYSAFDQPDQTLRSSAAWNWMVPYLEFNALRPLDNPQVVDLSKRHPEILRQRSENEVNPIKHSIKSNNHSINRLIKSNQIIDQLINQSITKNKQLSDQRPCQ